MHYITLHSSITQVQNAVNDVTGPELQKLLFATSIGQRLGNVLKTGTLHFAPSGPEVDSLLDHLNRTIPSLQGTWGTLGLDDDGRPNVKTSRGNSKVPVLVHDTEDQGVEFILNNPNEKPFALVVVHQASPFKVNYRIRMIYYTLPNTNRILQRTALGFSSGYQLYTYSGFFSIQTEVDKWAFEYTGAAPFNSTSTPSLVGAVIDGISTQEGISLASNQSTQSTLVSQGRDLYLDPTGGNLPRQTDEKCFKPDPFMTPFPVQEYEVNPFYGQVGYACFLSSKQ